jgi:hypothetical protein
MVLGFLIGDTLKPGWGMYWKSRIVAGISGNLLQGNNPGGSAYPLLLLQTINGFFVFFLTGYVFLKKSRSVFEILLRKNTDEPIRFTLRL